MSKFYLSNHLLKYVSKSGKALPLLLTDLLIWVTVSTQVICVFVGVFVLHYSVKNEDCIFYKLSSGCSSSCSIMGNDGCALYAYSAIAYLEIRDNRVIQ